jgi:hypothetical protein
MRSINLASSHGSLPVYAMKLDAFRMSRRPKTGHVSSESAFVALARLFPIQSIVLLVYVKMGGLCASMSARASCSS